MNRLFRINRYNEKCKQFDALFPQTVTSNILRRDNGGVLETYLRTYDTHLSDASPHLNRAYSTGNERHLNAHIRNKNLVDGFPLLLTIHTNLDCEPTLNFNGTGPKPIIGGSGDPIPGGQCAGTTMFLIWSKNQDAWTLLSSDTYSDVTKVLIPTINEYVYTADHNDISLIVIPGFDSRNNMLDINYGQTILRYGLDYEFIKDQHDAIRLTHIKLRKNDVLFFKITSYVSTAKRGSFRYDIEVINYNVTVENDDTSRMMIPVKAMGANYIEINYGQTILRNGLDYTITDDGTHINFNFTFRKDDIITFRAVKLVETNAEITPNNWGATGNYRYSINVLHEEYTATEDNITIIPVPNYNSRKDNLSIIRDNKLLVYDVDYTIDSLDQVVLLTSHLDTNDSIYFTILQGAMVDVPNFNVITASGSSGQHIHLDMSYSVLCDHYAILVKLIHPLEAAPTIKCIDGPAEPVCDCFGNPILGGYQAGSYLWLVYNETNKTWYSMSHSQLDVTATYPIFRIDEGDATYFGDTEINLSYGDDPNMIGETVIKHNLGMKPSQITIHPIEPPDMDNTGNRKFIGDVWYHADENYLYVGNTGNATSTFHWIVSTQTQNTDLRTYLENAIRDLNTKPGNFFTKQIVFTVTEDNTRIINIDQYDRDIHKILIVNYGQTVLRENVDYMITNDGIILNHISLYTDDILQILIVIQEPMN